MQCVIDGCSSKAVGRGWCHKHYKRWQVHGNPLTIVNPRIHHMTLKERILSTIKVVDDCWIWNGSKNKLNGRPRLKYKCKTTLAHRAAYIAFIGEIPDGLLVCHKCDNPLCVNPSHLYAGTISQNRRDAVIRGRLNLPCGEDHHACKLSDKQVLDIFNSKLASKDLASMYKVSVNTINGIRSGRQRWRVTNQLASSRRQGNIT